MNNSTLSVQAVCSDLHKVFDYVESQVSSIDDLKGETFAQKSGRDNSCDWQCRAEDGPSGEQAQGITRYATKILRINSFFCHIKTWCSLLPITSLFAVFRGSSGRPSKRIWRRNYRQEQPTWFDGQDGEGIKNSQQTEKGRHMDVFIPF